MKKLAPKGEDLSEFSVGEICEVRNAGYASWVGWVECELMSKHTEGWFIRVPGYPSGGERDMWGAREQDLRKKPRKPASWDTVTEITGWVPSEPESEPVP